MNNKNIIILHSTLSNAIRCMKQLKQWIKKNNYEADIKQILIYDNVINQKQKEIEINKYSNCGVDIVYLDIISFNPYLEKLYEDKSNLFIFSAYLLTDNASAFVYRVNIDFSLKHFDDKRIWIFTSAGDEIKKIIDNLFKDMVLDFEEVNGEFILQFDKNKEFLNKFL